VPRVRAPSLPSASQALEPQCRIPPTTLAAVGASSSSAWRACSRMRRACGT
jgi:hypothetical protein